MSNRNDLLHIALQKHSYCFCNNYAFAQQYRTFKIDFWPLSIDDIGIITIYRI